MSKPVLSASAGELPAVERRLSFFCRSVAAFISPFVDMEIRGNVGAKDVGPAIFASNHRSMSDVAIGMTTFARIGVFPRVLVSKKYLRGPFEQLARNSGVIPVPRSEKGSAAAAAEAAVEEVNKGARLMIMPEGKLFWDPSDPLNMGLGRTGMIRIARQTGVPIVPVAVDGTEILWEKGRPFPRLNPFKRKKVIVTLGEPITVSGDDPDDDPAQSAIVMAEIRTMLQASIESHSGPIGSLTSGS